MEGRREGGREGTDGKDEDLHDECGWGGLRETGRPLLNGNDQVASNPELSVTFSPDSLIWWRRSQSELPAAFM